MSGEPSYRLRWSLYPLAETIITAHLEGESEMFANVPRGLLWSVTAVIVVRAFVILFFYEAVFPALLWPVLFAALAISAFYGKKSAARVLALLLILSGITLVLTPFVYATSLFGALASCAWGIVAISVAVYIFRSKAVKAFYANASAGPSPTAA